MAEEDNLEFSSIPGLTNNDDNESDRNLFDGVPVPDMDETVLNAVENLDNQGNNTFENQQEPALESISQNPESEAEEVAKINDLNESKVETVGTIGSLDVIQNSNPETNILEKEEITEKANVESYGHEETERYELETEVHTNTNIESSQVENLDHTLENHVSQYLSEENQHINEPKVGEKRSIDDTDFSEDQPHLKGKWPGWPGESVFRLIVPVHKVGGIIGRKGEFVKKMCEETRARIKILDGVQGVDERVVLVTAKEEPDEPLPPAVVGLLRVHRQVVEGTDVDPTAPPAPEVMVGSITARLLVPTTQAGSLIGKQGITVRTIQDNSGALIRVLPAENMPPYALEDDRIVEISGAVRSVYLALELSLSHLRKFLVDRSVIPLFEKVPTRASRPSEHKSDLNSGWGSQSRGYSSVDRYNEPYSSRSSYDNGQYSYDYSSQQRAVSLYGRDSDPRRPPPPPPPAPAPPISAPIVSIKEVTASLQVPLSYADAIIGTNGANILFARRTSGATITIQETRSSTGVPEMVVEMKGNTQQVQTAEQLLQSFIAAPDQSTAAATGQTQQYSSGVPGQSQGAYDQQQVDYYQAGSSAYGSQTYY